MPIQDTSLKTSLSLITLTATLAFTASATPPATTHPDSASTPTIFWQIITPDGKDTSYLLGTIHMICVKDSGLPQAIQRAIQRSRLVVLEIKNINATNNPLLFFTLKRYLFLPDSLSLQDLYTPSEWQTIETAFRQTTGNELAIFHRLKPLALSTIWLALLFQQACPHEQWRIAIDQLIYQYARQNKKPIRGLETIRHQAQLLFSKIPLPIQAKMLYSFAASTDSLYELFNQLQLAYLNGNLTQIDELLRQPSPGLTPTEDSLVRTWRDSLLTQQRNDNWIDSLTQWLPRYRRLFIAVGTAHLTRSYGLVAQLRKHGYHLKPLTPPFKEPWQNALVPLQSTQ